MLKPYRNTLILLKFKHNNKLMRIIFGLCLLFCLSSCSMTTLKNEKINGVSFVASRDTISQNHVAPVIEVNANYAAIMPFGFIKDLKHPEISYNSNRQWFGETVAGTDQYISELKKAHIKIMLKPQIWVWHGEYTGHIEMENVSAWKELEQSYTAFILDYAKAAAASQVDIFCIGTELEKFVANRPEYWHGLIVEIRKIYKGKLTYAANWDEFKRTPFWKEMDYIGVDAYFPVSDTQTPTVLECIEGWKVHKDLLYSYATTFNKPILFTEFGYRSVDYSGKEPWKSDRNEAVANLEAQVNTTQALFETFWDEPWFAGGFIWKWFHNHSDSGGLYDNQFTPQNKPVEAVIKSQYKLQD
jgi:hypothetical protein